jgi:hypothetical protein
LKGGSFVNKEERIKAHLLEICQRARQDFTLRDIVSRVMHERPDMIHDFAQAWNELIHAKRIRLHRRGRPCTYELARDDVPSGGGLVGAQHP